MSLGLPTNPANSSHPLSFEGFPIPEDLVVHPEHPELGVGVVLSSMLHSFCGPMCKVHFEGTKKAHFCFTESLQFASAGTCALHAEFGEGQVLKSSFNSHFGRTYTISFKEHANPKIIVAAHRSLRVGESL
jgi:hypothetical protein